MTNEAPRSGPLEGTKIVEFEGIGPVPYAGMLLADFGADVVTVTRVTDRASTARPRSPMARGRRSIALDLKQPEAVDVALRLVDDADVLMEGFRPGVMERLGVGPELCLERNPALVYARMTGFGQQGPLASAPGHDINFIALAGVLSAIGPPTGPPVPPLNLIGDYGGGGMLLAVGVLAALLHSRATGVGQVVDAAMVDGVASLHASAFVAPPAGPRGTNMLDGGAPFYNAYETSDGRFVAVGAVESRFYERLVTELGLSVEDLPEQWETSGWPRTKQLFAEVFASRTRDEWCEVLEGTDACLSPVLEIDEVADHHHATARSMVIERHGFPQPNAFPRFGQTPATVAGPPPRAGEHSEEVLAALGLSAEQVARLLAAGAVA